jgi:hypothetical protein
MENVKTVKLICNHSGGVECDNCIHNTAHTSYQTCQGYCVCANDDMSGANVECHKVS